MATKCELTNDIIISDIRRIIKKIARQSPDHYIEYYIATQQTSELLIKKQYDVCQVRTAIIQIICEDPESFSDIIGDIAKIMYFIHLEILSEGGRHDNINKVYSDAMVIYKSIRPNRYARYMEYIKMSDQVQFWRIMSLLIASICLVIILVVVIAMLAI